MDLVTELPEPLILLNFVQINYKLVIATRILTNGDKTYFYIDPSDNYLFHHAFNDSLGNQSPFVYSNASWIYGKLRTYFLAGNSGVRKFAFHKPGDFVDWPCVNADWTEPDEFVAYALKKFAPVSRSSFGEVRYNQPSIP